MTLGEAQQSLLTILGLNVDQSGAVTCLKNRCIEQLRGVEADDVITSWAEEPPVEWRDAGLPVSEVQRSTIKLSFIKKMGNGESYPRSASFDIYEVRGCRVVEDYRQGSLYVVGAPAGSILPVGTIICGFHDKKKPVVRNSFDAYSGSSAIRLLRAFSDEQNHLNRFFFLNPEILAALQGSHSEHC